MNSEDKKVKEDTAPNGHREKLSEDVLESVAGGHYIADRTSWNTPKERRAGMLLDKMREGYKVWE